MRPKENLLPKCDSEVGFFVKSLQEFKIQFHYSYIHIFFNVRTYVPNPSYPKALNRIESWPQ